MYFKTQKFTQIHLKSGTNVNAKDSETCGQIHSRWTLVKSKVFVGVSGVVRLTAFMVACRFGNLECATLCVEKGADVDAKDNNGYPLCHSVCVFVFVTE